MKSNNKNEPSKPSKQDKLIIDLLKQYCPEIVYEMTKIPLPYIYKVKNDNDL